MLGFFKKNKLKNAIIGMALALAFLAQQSTTVPNPTWGKLSPQQQARVIEISNENRARIEGNKFAEYLNEGKFDDAEKILNEIRTDAGIVFRIVGHNEEEYQSLMVMLEESEAVLRLRRNEQKVERDMQHLLDKLKLQSIRDRIALRKLQGSGDFYVPEINPIKKQKKRK